MSQPVGFLVEGHQGKINKLKRSIYGLKQSFKKWYLKFYQVILETGFEMSPLDHCVHVWRCDKKLIVFSLYVDDIKVNSIFILCR